MTNYKNVSKLKIYDDTWFSAPEWWDGDLFNIDGQNIDMNIVLTEGLTAGLRKLGEGFENGEVFYREKDENTSLIIRKFI